MERTLKMPIDLSTILDGALKLIGGALGVKVFDYFLKKRREKKEVKQKDVFLSNLKEISLMNHHMCDVIDNTPVERFLVLCGHDSGNIPNPKHPYYARAMWQKVTRDTDDDSLIRKYDSVRVDLDYINMVIQLMQTNCVKLKVADMPNCFLKTIYQSEGVRYSEIYFLAQERSNKIYYCSLATTKDNETFDNFQHRGRIEIAINHLRQIFSTI